MKTNREILNALDVLVYGHTTVKKSLITCIQRSKERYYQTWGLMRKQEAVIPKMNVLILGQSGTGKTLMVESLAKLLTFPLIRLDATNLTPSGNSEGTGIKLIHKMIRDNAQSLLNTHENYKSIEGIIDQTVVFIDEIDKLGLSFDSTGNWNKQIQANLLGMVEDQGLFKNVTFVFAGAFNALREKQVKSRGIGFNLAEVEPVSEKNTDITKAGIIPELAGRINMIRALDVFTAEDFKKVLEDRILPNMEQQMPHLFIDFTNEEKDAIVKEALENKQGIRAMQRSVNERYMELEFDAPIRGYR